MLAELSRLLDETETAASRAARTVNSGVERMFVGLAR